MEMTPAISPVSSSRRQNSASVSYTHLDVYKRQVISATISQQPRKQGSRSLDLLFEYLTSGAPPVQEKNFVEHSIKIRENS